MSIKERIVSICSNISGFVSIIGSWQVCHTLCLGIIMLLSMIGITITTFPLLFLTKIAKPFWIIAVILFLITLYFYFTKKCISKNLIIINLWILIIGMPYAQDYYKLLWIIGAIPLLLSVIFLIRDRFYK